MKLKMECTKLFVLIVLTLLNSGRTYDNEKPWEAIYYGYKVDGKSPSFLSKANAIFDIPDKLINDNVARFRQPRTTMKKEYSDSLHTASKKIAVSLSIKGSYGAFSGAASMSLGKSTDSSIKTVRLDYYIKAIEYMIMAKNYFKSHPEKFLTQSFKDSVKTKSVEELEGLIGVFYATKLYLGGEIRKSFIMQATTEDNESKVTAEVEARYDNGLSSVEMKVGMKESVRSSNSNAKVKEELEAMGGDATVWLGQGFKLGKDPSSTKIQTEWAKSINKNNLFAFDFDVKPTWDLVRAVDKAKGDEFQKYLEKKWQLQAHEFSPVMFLNSGSKGGKWTSLSNDNQEGTSSWDACSRGRITAMRWYEKKGSGLTNVKFLCSSDYYNKNFKQLTKNEGGKYKELNCDAGFGYIMAYVRGNEGIVNLAYKCRDDYGHSTKRLNYERGTANKRLSCSKGVMTGLQVRETAEAGITNFKVLCADLPWRYSPTNYIHYNGRWGDWADTISYCPDHGYAVSFTQRVEPDRGRGDDTALNTICLKCSNGREICSKTGYFGEFATSRTCEGGFNAANLKFEWNGGRDDTAANSLMLRCRSDYNRWYETGNGGIWGKWLGTKYCSGNTVICGLRTRVERYLGNRKDDTALNGVWLACCNHMKN